MGFVRYLVEGNVNMVRLVYSVELVSCFLVVKVRLIGIKRIDLFC